MNLDQEPNSRPYSHAKNIHIGHGRILWADYVIDSYGIAHQAGWVLPGGTRTTDEGRARAMAKSISEARK